MRLVLNELNKLSIGKLLNNFHLIYLILFSTRKYLYTFDNLVFIFKSNAC